jgi:four helix bundle protein
MADEIEWPPTFENGQDIRDRAFEFGCRIVIFCKALHESGGVARGLASQLLGCGTSIAAMLVEARAAESRPDFISKCSIGLKEARESHSRLRTCVRTQIAPAQEAEALAEEANEIVSILTAIVCNARRNAKLNSGGQKRRRIPNS